MKKIKDIEQLQEILGEIIISQKQDEIKNFNTLYDYSSITDMTFLWSGIKEKLYERKKLEDYLKKDWKNIKFPILNMENVKFREEIFKNCPLYEINLINTQNIKEFTGGFKYTKNLEQISLDLSSCEKRNFIFYESNVKEVELLNTQNIQNFSYRFSYTENLEKISLDLIGCEDRGKIFHKSNIKEVKLKNTQNIKKLYSGFEDTKNLKKVNDLYLDNCEDMNNCFGESNIEKVNLYNTGKVKEWYGCFWYSNIEEVELDMKNRENCEHMFNLRKVKKINLKNCENIKNIGKFIRGCENLDYLEMNISNIENKNDFINEKNNIKYLKLTGLEGQKLREKEIREEFIELFFYGDQKTNQTPYIELVKNNTTFNIIGDNNSNMRLEKKEKKEKMMNIKKEKIKEKEGKLKSQKEYNLEINI